MKFLSTILAVSNVKKSQAFYQELLNQKVLYDFGKNIAFESGIALHDKNLLAGLIGKELWITTKPHDMELYFESEDLDQLEEQLKQKKIHIIHSIQEQPWGQRVIRFYDPDGHIIEAGEVMSGVIKRLTDNGLNEKEIQEKTGVPQEILLAISKR